MQAQVAAGMSELAGYMTKRVALRRSQDTKWAPRFQNVLHTKKRSLMTRHSTLTLDNILHPLYH